MKRFVFAIFLIFSIIMCALTGCSVPIGSLEGGNPSNNYAVEAMWLVPRRQLYQIDEKFLRDEDFQIFIVDHGGVVEVLPPFNAKSGIEIEISGNHNLSNEFHFVVDSTHYPFYTVGTHRITVTYRQKSAWYAVEVFSPNNGNSLGGDGGIGIIWLD
jgi:hypothetical protein